MPGDGTKGAKAKQLLTLAENAVISAASGEEVDAVHIPESLANLPAQGNFITLSGADGSLRGCRGEVMSIWPLGRSVVRNAFAAALDDPRFSPLGKSELEGLEVGLSLLSPLTEVVFADTEELIEMLDQDRPGVLLRAKSGGATYLPSVWHHFPSARAFLASLLEKGGWGAKAPSDLRCWTYTAASTAAPIGSGARRINAGLQGSPDS